MCNITVVIIKKPLLRGRAVVFAHRAVVLLSLVVSIADVATGAAQPSGGCVGVISTGAAQFSGEYVGDARNVLAPEQQERCSARAL